MKKQILIILLSSFSYFAYGQQDAIFSQYIFNGIYINPAYAGYKEELNLHSFYRTQWTGISGAPQTISLAVDAIANNGNVGLALQLVNDRLGAQRNTTAYASYAYRLRLNEDGSSRLAFGVSGGVAQFGIDPTKYYTTETEMNYNTSNRNIILPDARAGIYFANNRYFAGISADNLIASQFDDSRFKGNIPKPRVHSYLTAGALFPLNQSIQLKPSFLLREDFHSPTSIDFNVFFLLGERIWVGGSYRVAAHIWTKPEMSGFSPDNSAVAAVQLFPMRSLRLGYAYDFAVGPLRTYSGGTHEISVGFYFNRSSVRMGNPRVF